MLYLLLILYFFGILLNFKASRSIYSPLMFVTYVWIFPFIGGLILYKEKLHIHTPFIILLGLIFMGVGANFSKLFLSFNPKFELIRKKYNAYNISNPNGIMIQLILYILIIITIIFSILLFLYKGSPILDANALRSGSAPGLGLFQRIYNTFLPLLIMIFYIREKSKLDKFILFISILINIILLILFGFKGGIVWFGVYIIITLNFYIKKKYLFYISTTFIVISLLIIINIAPLLEFYQNDVFSSLLDRITILQVEGLDYIIYEIVPNEGFYYGETFFRSFEIFFKQLIQNIGFEASDKLVLAQELFLKKHGWLNFNETTINYSNYMPISNINTNLVGDFYINGGFLGVIFFSFIYGVVIEYLYIKTIRIKSNLFLLPILSMIQFEFVKRASSGTFFMGLLNRIFELFLFILIFLVFYIILGIILNKNYLKIKL